MTPERIEKLARKRQIRRERNLAHKRVRAGQRQRALVELGKTVVETKDAEGNVTLDFAPTPKVWLGRPAPTLAHIIGKTYRKAAAPRKTRLKFAQEHAAAIPEDASRSLAKAIDAALATGPEVVAVNTNVA